MKGLIFHFKKFGFFPPKGKEEQFKDFNQRL